MSDPIPVPDHPEAAAAAPAVSILVISYNTRAMTLACLASVIAETTVPYELIVLDNASPDGSAEAIAAAFPAAAHPELRLIASRENHGFAKGNNIAAREARGELLLLLNPDTLVKDKAIDRLVAFAGRTPAAGIWGGRTLTGEGRLDPGCVFADQTLWSLVCRATGLALVLKDSPVFNPEMYGGWKRDSARAVDAVMGCFFLIRRSLWDALGGFDLTFVMYGEEADLCRRARAMGAQPWMTPEAEIIHYGGASAPRVDREILKMKARVTLARRHLAPWQRPLGVLLLKAWPFSRAIGGASLARLLGREGGASGHWRQVWTRRAEWQEGFPALPHP